MAELKFEEVTPYLPFRLKWTLQEMKTFTMSGLTKETLYTEEGKVLNWDLSGSDLPQALFPLLKPVSDFRKKPIGDIKKELELPHTKTMEFLGFMDGEIKLENISLGLYHAMCKKHLDFNRLIEKGLAIDINNVNEEK